MLRDRHLIVPDDGCQIRLTYFETAKSSESMPKASVLSPEDSLLRAIIPSLPLVAFLQPRAINYPSQ